MLKHGVLLILLLHDHNIPRVAVITCVDACVQGQQGDFRLFWWDKVHSDGAADARRGGSAQQNHNKACAESYAAGGAGPLDAVELVHLRRGGVRMG